ncbi:MAG: hypothetical protein ACKOTA_00250, partial [Solirubrobacterales bacterium]
MALSHSARLDRIPAYPTAAGYELPEDVAMLASNESHDPPIPEVVAAVEGVMKGLNRYPDPTGTKLREALSERYGVPAPQIALGNGSCDILLALGDALRSEIMPVNERYPMAEVLEACNRYYEAKRRMVFIEYVMLAG